jgi:hypothetical protein
MLLSSDGLGGPRLGNCEGSGVNQVMRLVVSAIVHQHHDQYSYDICCDQHDDCIAEIVQQLPQIGGFPERGR